MRTEHVTTITTPKGKLGIVSLVKEELALVYFKTTHILVHFHLRRTPRMQNSSCIGQYECKVRLNYLTRIVQVLCLGGHIHIEVPGLYAL